VIIEDHGKAQGSEAQPGEAGPRAS
jgi:hypothetical protein